MKLELKKIGNSTGLILPKELLSRLGLQQGDEVVISETSTGFSVGKSAHNLDKGMEIARVAMQTYRAALTELAK